MLLSRLNEVYRSFAAPFLYLAGKSVRSQKLLERALAVDPRYFRAFEQSLLLQGRPIDTVAQLGIGIELISQTKPGSEELIKRWIAVSESQLLQDIVCILAHTEKKQGYFVEVGVGDGKTFSNTYALEKHFGWQGILSEPNPNSHQSITSCRTAILDKRAAYNVSGSQFEFEINEEFGELSRLSVHEKGGKSSAGANSNRYVSVESVSLTDLLEEYKAPNEIDFISIDTEGSEPAILSGLDLRRWQFGLMAIEHCDRPGELAAMKSRLEPLGYRQILQTVSRFDAWFINEQIKSPYLS